jgi:hypothetical protein
MPGLRALAAITRDRRANPIRRTRTPNWHGIGVRPRYEDRDGCWAEPSVTSFRWPRRLRARRHAHGEIRGMHADLHTPRPEPAFILGDIRVFYRGQRTNGLGQQCAVYADQLGYAAAVLKHRPDGSLIPDIELARQAALELKENCW